MKDVWGIRSRREIARKGVSISRLFFLAPDTDFPRKQPQVTGKVRRYGTKERGIRQHGWKGGEQTMT